MNAWTWVLAGLCVAGVLLPLAGALIVLRLALRLRSRAEQLRRSRLFTSLESMQLQSARAALLASRAAPLMQRAQAALATIRSAGAAGGYPEMRDALQNAGAEIDALIADLR